ncbi:MAG: DUF1565 domain-containing protein, partial [Rudaea sp.]
MDVFTAFRRAVIACASLIVLGAAVQARADEFSAVPLQGREVGPFIAGQGPPAPGGGWQASDDRLLNASINGQEGWTSNAALDEEIATGIAHDGAHAWRISNWFHNGVVNHALSPAFAAVGESGTQTSDGISAVSNHVVFTFWVLAPTAPNTGGQVSTSLTDVAGRRMTYADMRDDGTHVTLRTVGISPSAGVVGAPPFDDENYVINTSPDLQRGAWYRVVEDVTFVAGEDNDVVAVSLYSSDGTQQWSVVNAYSWEPAYYDGSFATAGTKVAINRIGYRVAENPDCSNRCDAGTYSVTNRPVGFYFDDVSALPDSGASYATSFEFDRWVATADGVDSGDCSVQATPCQTIAYAIAQSNPYDKINIAGGEYDLASGAALTVAKEGLQLVGEDPNNKPVIKRSAGSVNQALLVIPGAKNVQVQNLEFDMDQTFIAEAIIANGFVDGLSIDGNDFVTSQSNSGASSKYSWRNAISINDDNGNSQNIGLGTGSNVSVTNNTISGLADPANGVFLRSGVDMDNGVGTISGNTITTGVHDIRVRFSTVTGNSSGTATTISSNVLHGRGLEVDDPNAG